VRHSSFQAPLNSVESPSTDLARREAPPRLFPLALVKTVRRTADQVAKLAGPADFSSEIIRVNSSKDKDLATILDVANTLVCGLLYTRPARRFQNGPGAQPPWRPIATVAW
jgi:hypothetical protein